MKTLQERMDAANALLAAYAVPHQGTLGRAFPEPDDATRFPFQRDRDRIIHTHAFRRLQGKTQVFTTGESDHYRTRLTHTLEVAQISRDIARTLRLNEDLTECIALAHDLGHPPFGHAGEEALNQYMMRHGGHFEHNHQSLHIVTCLEEHSSLYAGLNLNLEVLEGLQKHEHVSHGPTLEAQLTDLADEIAYTAHDCEDGLRSGLFNMQDLLRIPLIQKGDARTKERQTSLRGSIIHLLTQDLYTQSINRLEEKNIVHSLKDVYEENHKILGFSAEITEELAQVRAFLWQHLYLTKTVQQSNADGQHIILALCERYESQPIAKITALQKKTGSALPEAIKDYVAGMTDPFARAQMH